MRLCTAAQLAMQASSMRNNRQQLSSKEAPAKCPVLQLT